MKVTLKILILPKFSKNMSNTKPNRYRLTIKPLKYSLTNTIFHYQWTNLIFSSYGPYLYPIYIPFYHIFCHLASTSPHWYVLTDDWKSTWGGTVENRFCVQRYSRVYTVKLRLYRQHVWHQCQQPSGAQKLSQENFLTL